MNAVLDKIRREPAVVVGFVGALIGLFLAFGIDLTNEQTGAIMATVVAGLAFVTRSQVTPTVAVGAAQENDSPNGDLLAGPASELANDTPVDVVPAEDTFGSRPLYDQGGVLRSKRDEAGESLTNIAIIAACIAVVIVAIVYLV
jgi:hypothetical protein